MLRLGSCAEVAGGVTLGRNAAGATAIELPYLRVANVQDGFLDLSEIKTIRIYKSELERYVLKRGDVLMNEGGDFDKLGRGCVWEEQIQNCLHQNRVFRVRSQTDALSFVSGDVFAVAVWQELFRASFEANHESRVDQLNADQGVSDWSAKTF